MFWALDQRREWRRKWREEARKEGYALARQELAEREERLERRAREMGISLDEPPQKPQE